MTKSEWNIIVCAAIKQDPQAFDAIVCKKMKTILFYTKKFIYQPSYAEDAAQEVVLQMYKSFGSLQTPEAFNVWMHRIILGVCCNMNKKFPAFSYIDDMEEAPLETKVTVLPQIAAEENDRNLRILEAVNSLALRQRLAITMFYYDEMSYKEIAQVLGITVPGVSATMGRAKKALKMRLSKKEDMQDEEKLFLGMFFAPALSSAFEAEANLLTDPSTLKDLTEKSLKSTDAIRKSAVRIKAAFSVKALLGALLLATLSTFVLVGGVLFTQVSRDNIQASIIMNNTTYKPADHINPVSIQLELNDFSGQVIAWEIENANNQIVARGDGIMIEDDRLFLSPGRYKAVWTLEENQTRFFVRRTFVIQ